MMIGRDWKKRQEMTRAPDLQLAPSSHQVFVERGRSILSNDAAWCNAKQTRDNFTADVYLSRYFGGFWWIVPSGELTQQLKMAIYSGFSY